jgi:hypothetical protein
VVRRKPLIRKAALGLEEARKRLLGLVRQRSTSLDVGKVVGFIGRGMEQPAWSPVELECQCNEEDELSDF